MAIVSSTTPRLGPRCPPVWERTETRSSRTSWASCGKSCSLNAFTSAGERMPSSKRFFSLGLEEFDVVIVVAHRLRRLLNGRSRIIGRFKILYKSFSGIVPGDDLNLFLR